MSLKKQFTFFETSHIERAKNSRADELANEAMDTRSSRGFDSE
jgi:ribonuclease HI